MTVAVDGWTNVRHDKVINVCLMTQQEVHSLTHLFFSRGFTGGTFGWFQVFYRNGYVVDHADQATLATKVGQDIAEVESWGGQEWWQWCLTGRTCSQ